MCINNLNKGTIVVNHIWLATTFWQRLKGLLGSRSLGGGYGLVIKPCNSIHTFGMNYSIDVLFVDRDDRIIKIVACMPAGRVTMKSGSAYVIELPSGTVGQTLCAVGDRLEFK